MYNNNYTGRTHTAVCTYIILNGYDVSLYEFWWRAMVIFDT